MPLQSFAAIPVLDDPLALENASPRVEPIIPVGKTLVLPLLAADADGDVLNFAVKSSNPNILARVRTGCPILKIHVSYAGDPNRTPAAPAFEGDLEFQLFRDATPTTSGIIGGAAQAGFYSGQIFHRVIPGFVIQGGDPAGTGSGNVGFSFEHEFRPELIFSGRGQLAMANSQGGYERGTSLGSGFIQLGDFSATNGSQFFVTIDQPRSLDFKHTIFGQLLRGFDVLDKVAAVPRGANDKPTVDVKMTTVSVTPSKSQATLMLSAKSAGAAVLTVTATDPVGGKAVRNIRVLSKRDTVNNPPLLRPISNLITPVATGPSLPLKGIDLEHDYLLYGIASAGGNTSAGSYGAPQIASTFTPRNSAGPLDLVLGVAGFNDPLLNSISTASNPFAPFDPYRFQIAEIGYGDRAILVEPAVVQAEAGAAVSQAVLATFADADAAGGAADFTATVNWGDGTAQQASTGSSPQIRVIRSTTEAGTLEVQGTHTYARPGVYLVEVLVDSALGATGKVRAQAVVSSPGATLRITGQTVSNAQAILNNRVLATFTDTTPGVQASDFKARIDWGDGRSSRGLIVEASPGRFAVQGTHRYVDVESFGVFVHLTRVAPAATAVAWSRVNLSGFRAPRHLPPFPAAHLVGELTALPGATLKKTSGSGASSVTRFSVSIIILNSGDIPSKQGTVRFYLSENQTFNAKKVDKAGTVNDSPADALLKIGTFEEGNIPALEPGSSIRYNLGNSTDSAGTSEDLRLVAPAGKTGSGSYILAHFNYSDPLADQLPISRDVVLGRINGIIVNRRALTITEAAGAGHTGTFNVVLDARPDADVTLNFPLPTSATEISIDKTQVKFTTSNWNVPQTVTVTATNDTADDGNKSTTINLGNAVSADAAWSGMTGGTVQVTTVDDDPQTAP